MALDRQRMVTAVKIDGRDLTLVEDTREGDDAGSAPAFTRRWEDTGGVAIVTWVTAPGVDLEAAVHDAALGAAFEASLTAGLPEPVGREAMRSIYALPSTPAELALAVGSLPKGLSVRLDDIFIVGAQDATVTVVVRHARGVQPVLELSALR